MGAFHIISAEKLCLLISIQKTMAIGVLIKNTEVVRALSRYYQSTSVLQIRFPVTYILRDGVFRDT